VVRVGDEYGWTSFDGVPHYGEVVETHDNVICIACRYCGDECEVTLEEE